MMSRVEHGDWILRACFVFALLSLFAGCARVRQARELQRVDDHLRAAKMLLRQGDYEGALRENERALELARGRPPADEAIFNMGVIYTQPENAEKDEEKASGYFRRVIEEYPESRFAAWAKVWLGMIKEGEASQGEEPEFELKRRGAGK